MNNISMIIRVLLKLHKITQSDFSLKTEIPLPTIKKYLQGAFNPTNKNIEKINSAYNINIEKILDYNLKEYDDLEKLESFCLEEIKKQNEKLIANKNSDDEFAFLDDIDIEKKIENNTNMLNIIRELKYDIFNHKTEVSESSFLKQTDYDLIELLKKIGVDVRVYDKSISFSGEDITLSSVSIENFNFLSYLLKKGLVENLKNNLLLYDSLYDSFYKYFEKKNDKKDTD